jgi:hypothetical protein
MRLSVLSYATTRSAAPCSSQRAGRTSLMRGCRRAVAFPDGASLSAVPGGGPIVQPRVWRPHVSHRKNKRFGSRANVSSCPSNRQRSVEGVSHRRSSFNMAASSHRGRTQRLGGRTRECGRPGGGEPAHDERQAAHDERHRRRERQWNVPAGTGQHHNGDKHQEPQRSSHVSTVPQPAVEVCPQEHRNRLKPACSVDNACRPHLARSAVIRGTYQPDVLRRSGQTGRWTVHYGTASQRGSVARSVHARGGAAND